MGVQRGLIAQVIVRGMMEGGARMEEVMGMIQQLRELDFKQVRGDVEGEEGRGEGYMHPPLLMNNAMPIFRAM